MASKQIYIKIKNTQKNSPFRQIKIHKNGKSNKTRRAQSSEWKSSSKYKQQEKWPNYGKLLGKAAKKLLAPIFDYNFPAIIDPFSADFSVGFLFNSSLCTF